MKKASLSPKDHPNAYATASVGGLTAFIVTEAKIRLGLDLTVDEAAWIVVGTTTAFHFAARYLGGRKSSG